VRLGIVPRVRRRYLTSEEIEAITSINIASAIAEERFTFWFPEQYRLSLESILHKIGDANVISRLKRSLGVVGDSLWSRLPNPAPGQALVAMSSFARPLLINIDPTPCKLRMVE
jgi:hypothetical protein